MDMQETLRTQALLLETVSEQKKLQEQAHLAEQAYRQEHAQLREQLAHAASALQQMAQRLEQGGQRFGDEALRVIDTGSRKVLGDNLVEAIEQVHRRTGEMLQQLQRAAEAAGEQARQLKRAQTVLVWKSLAVLAVGSLVLVGGTGMWVWTSKGEAQRYQVDAETGRRIGQSDFVQCGEGLCANVDLKAKRIGDKKQYLPVKPR